MRWKARLIAGLAVTATVIPGAVPAAAAAPGPQGQEGQGSGPTPRTVTLITGDRISVQERAGTTPAISVEPGQGREAVTFSRIQDAKGWSVIPSDALGLVAKGVLDRQLFRIDRLLADGYDDKARPTLPLIVQYHPGIRAAAALPGTEQPQALASIGATAVAQRKNQATELWSALFGGTTARAASAGVKKVWLNRKVKASLDQSVGQIGAPQAWQQGLTGKGVTVAVLDTGVDATHPDLAGKVDSAENFSSSADNVDRFGHGTHVASIVAGSGAASGGKYKGVAPDARLIAGKVLGDDGSGDWAGIVRGMEWAAERGAKVINLSLGGTDDPELDPAEEAVNRITADKGVLFVIASGNEGPDAQTVGTPGSADAALTVGAVDRNSQLADFSSRGPRVGDGGLKPEITGPGVQIVAARAAGTRGGVPGNDRYSAYSGTSMATPHVAGAAAIMAQQHPDWKADRLKATLAGTAKPTPGLNVYQQGAGQVDLARSTTQQVTPDAANVAFGRLPWPTQPAPIAKELTYRNAGSTPVELDLKLEVRDGDGKPAADGMFTTSAKRVTVPAGGTAAVTLTLNAKGRTTGEYDGRLVATAASGATVQTPVGASLEREQYNVDLKLVNRRGKGPGQPGASGYIVMVTSLDSRGGTQFYCATDSKDTLRVDRGRHMIVAVGKGLLANCDLEGEPDDSLIVEPGVEVTADRSLVMDGSKAHRVKVHTDRSDSRSNGQVIGFFQKRNDGGQVSYQAYEPRMYNDDNHSYVAATKGNVPGFQFGLTTMLSRQDKDGRPENSPYLYNLAITQQGSVPDVGALRMRDRDLAEVRATYASSGDKQFGNMHIMPNTEEAGFAWFLSASTKLPAIRTEFYTPSDKIRWLKRLRVDESPGNGMLSNIVEVAPAQAYQKGRTQTEQWNRGVFGPSFSAGTAVAERSGNDLRLLFPMGLPGSGGRNAGASLEGTTRLARDGKEIGSWPEVPSAQYPDGSAPFFTVPKEPGKYTLTIDANRDVYSTATLSTKISNTWTFNSGHVDGTAKLPLMVLRSAPDLDEYNAAPWYWGVNVPIEVQKIAGAPGGAVREVKAEVSFDDGQRWQRSDVSKSGADKAGADKWQTWVHPPLWPTPKYVSLRLSATDKDGNSVTQTIIHAYRIR